MTRLAVARHLASVSRVRASRAVADAVAVPDLAVTGPDLAVTGPTRSTRPEGLLDRSRLDRELDLVVSAVQRQRPGVDAAELALLVAATATELAARHPVDGYFPVLVRVALLGRLPEH